jgi:hypothetical protein
MMSRPISESKPKFQQLRLSHWPCLVSAFVLSVGIISATVYGNLSVNLDGEYFRIARALADGKGFADPFGAPTGPTAWQAPLLPILEAAILWATDGSASSVVRVIVVLHVFVLIATGMLVIGITWQTSGQMGAVAAAIAYAVALACNFRICFELTSDPWMNLLFLDLFLIGAYWVHPFLRRRRTIGWGALGGVAALANPVLGLVWATLTVGLAVQSGTWRRLAVTMVVAVLVVTPWMIRNYVVFGRWIPVKSNLGYELFQAQCLQPPGVLTVAAIGAHPSNGTSQERQEYERLGEPDYVARKWEQFAEAVWADPLDFLNRLASRFLCATVWYESPDAPRDARRPWLIWLNRCTHPLPFVALVVLLVVGIQGGMKALDWFVISIYVAYLSPYIVASYYDRYGLPLIGVKVLLLVCAMERLAAYWRASTWMRKSA